MHNLVRVITATTKDNKHYVEEMACNYLVYQHISPNGKKYYGITSQFPPEKRWGNGNGYKSNKQFYADIVKYGWNNIHHNIVLKHLNAKMALFYEYALILRDNTFIESNGYNHDSVDIDYFLEVHVNDSQDYLMLDEILKKYANTSISQLKRDKKEKN